MMMMPSEESADYARLSAPRSQALFKRLSISGIHSNDRNLRIGDLLVRSSCALVVDRRQSFGFRLVLLHADVM